MGSTALRPVSSVYAQRLGTAEGNRDAIREFF
jgi:hypothetical protein